MSVVLIISKCWSCPVTSLYSNPVKAKRGCSYHFFPRSRTCNHRHFSLLCYAPWGLPRGISCLGQPRQSHKRGIDPTPSARSSLRIELRDPQPLAYKTPPGLPPCVVYYRHAPIKAKLDPLDRNRPQRNGSLSWCRSFQIDYRRRGRLPFREPSAEPFSASENPLLRTLLRAWGCIFPGEWAHQHLFFLLLVEPSMPESDWPDRPQNTKEALKQI